MVEYNAFEAAVETVIAEQPGGSKRLSWVYPRTLRLLAPEGASVVAGFANLGITNDANHHATFSGSILLLTETLLLLASGDFSEEDDSAMNRYTVPPLTYRVIPRSAISEVALEVPERHPTSLRDKATEKLFSRSTLRVSLTSGEPLVVEVGEDSKSFAAVYVALIKDLGKSAVNEIL